MGVFEWRRLIDINLKKQRKMFHVSESIILQDAITNLRSPEGRKIAKNMIDLEKDQCRWPINEVFCGCTQTVKSSYCPKHEKLSRGKNKKAENIEDVFKEETDHEQYLHAREIQAIIEYEQSLR